MQPCDEGTRKISHIVDALPNSAEEEDVPNGACPRTQREEKIHVSELPEYKTTIGKVRRESWQRFVTIGFGWCVLVVFEGKSDTAIIADIAIRNQMITKLTHLCNDIYNTRARVCMMIRIFRNVSSKYLFLMFQ